MKSLILRFFSLLASLAVVFLLTRGMIRALPGDPFEVLMAEQSLSSDAGDSTQKGDYFQQDLKRLLHGDFGYSIVRKKSVSTLIHERFTASLTLALLSLGLGLWISLVLSVISALASSPRLARFANLGIDLLGAFAASVPLPLVAPLLIYLFAVRWRIFPLSESLALPTLSLAIYFAGLWARLIRSRITDQSGSLSVVSARGRGISELILVTKYSLAPVSGALIAFLGTQFGALLAGTFITEVIFHHPGMGSLLIDSVLARDYPVIQAATFVAASSCLIGNALGDVGHFLVDPRRRQASS